MPCKNHADRLVELYCSSHQELICMLCFPTSHRECGQVQAVSDVARQKRAELKDRADKLLGQEAKLSAQIQATQNEFKTMRKAANDVFDDLENLLQKRRGLVLNNIQAEEAASMASLRAMEKDRTTLKAHAETVKKMTSNAANDALLDMLGKLTSRLQSLEQSSGAEHQKEASVEVTFDAQALQGLKDSISVMGEVKKVEEKIMTLAEAVSVAQASPSLPPASHSGLASIWVPSAPDLKSGDRVKRGVGWSSGDKDGGGPGTVEPTSPLDVFSGRVTVLWDNTGHGSRHRSRADGLPALQLL